MQSSPRLPYAVIGCAALVVAIGVLLSHLVGFSVWIDKVLFLQSKNFQVSEILSGSDFVGGKTAPLAFGSIADPSSGYLHISFRFRVDDTEGYPNLFQTAPVNKGLRLEISGSNAGFVIADSVEANGLRGLTLSNKIEKEHWYALEVEALNGAYVRATLDGASAAEFGGPQIAIEISDILVGGGFDSSRTFRGEIRDIQVEKGHLVFPHNGLAVTYGLVFALFVALYYAMRIVTKDNGALFTFVNRVAFFAAPLVLCVLFIEYRLSFLNTTYYLKRLHLERQMQRIETLVLGSSNTVYGIDPGRFNSQSFNLAFLGNAMSVDEKLTRAYLPRMKKLKQAIVSVNFFTMGMDYSTFPQNWRQYFVEQFFGISTAQYGVFSYWLDPRNFSKIGLYGESTATYVLAGYTGPVDIVTTPDGWLNSGTSFGTEDQAEKFGAAAAASHQNSFDENFFQNNCRRLAVIIREFQAHNVKVVVVLLPTYKTYHDKLGVKFEHMSDTLKALSSSLGAGYWNYTKDPRFTLEDYTPSMPDHMNAQGAAKFSQILAKDLSL